MQAMVYRGPYRVRVQEKDRPAIEHPNAAGRPDRLIAETGVRGELTGHGAASRLGERRADRGHHLLDPVVVAAPWLLGAGITYAVARRLARRNRD